MEGLGDIRRRVIVWWIAEVSPYSWFGCKSITVLCRCLNPGGIFNGPERAFGISKKVSRVPEDALGVLGKSQEPWTSSRVPSVSFQGFFVEESKTNSLDLCFLCKWKALWTLAADLLCRVSCSSSWRFINCRWLYIKSRLRLWGEHFQNTEGKDAFSWDVCCQGETSRQVGIPLKSSGFRF